MATLLIEIGCEELPASACREASDAASRALAAALRRAGQVLVGPRRLALLAENVPEVTEDTWVKGPTRASARAGRRRVRQEARRLGRRSRAARRLPRRDRAGPPPARHAPRGRGRARARARLRQVDGLDRRRPALRPSGSLALREARRRDDSGGRGRHSRRAASPTGTASRTARSRSPRPTRTPRRCARAGVEPDEDARRETIAAGLRRARARRAEPARARRGRVPRGEPDRRRGELRRALPLRCRSASSRPRWSRTSATSRSAATRFAFVANGGDPDLVRRGNERVLAGRLEDASFTFERDVAEGIEAPGREARHDHVRRRRGHVRRHDRAADRARRGARRRRRVAARRLGSRRPTRRRSSSASSPTSRATSAPSTRAWRASPRRSASAIEEQYLPDAADGPLPQTEAGRVLAAADKIDSLTVAFALGKRPTGSRDPFGLRRAAIGLCRLAVEAGLEIRRAGARRPRPRAAQRPERRGEGRPVGRLGLRARAPGGTARRPRRVRARRPRRVRSRSSAPSRASPSALAAAVEHRRVRPRLRRVSTARTAWPDAPRAPRKQLDPKLATEPAETALVEALAAAGPRDRRRRLRRATSRRPSRPRPRSARRSTRSSTTCSSWPRTRRSAQTACGCCSTCATRSADWATCRRSLARLALMSDPVELHVDLGLDRRDRGQARERRRGPVPRARVRRDPASADRERGRRAARAPAGAQPHARS